MKNLKNFNQNTGKRLEPQKEIWRNTFCQFMWEKNLMNVLIAVLKQQKLENLMKHNARIHEKKKPINCSICNNNSLRLFHKKLYQTQQ